MQTATGSEPRLAGREAISADELAAPHASWLAANSHGAARIDLRDNALLEPPLRPEHIKPRRFDHRATVPGIKFLHAHLDWLIRAYDADVLLVTRPGPDAPARISAPGAAVPIWVVPADEERQIAREVAGRLEARRSPS